MRRRLFLGLALLSVLGMSVLPNLGAGPGTTLAASIGGASIWNARDGYLYYGDCTFVGQIRATYDLRVNGASGRFIVRWEVLTNGTAQYPDGATYVSPASGSYVYTSSSLPYGTSGYTLLGAGTTRCALHVYADPTGSVLATVDVANVVIRTLAGTAGQSAPPVGSPAPASANPSPSASAGSVGCGGQGWDPEWGGCMSWLSNITPGGSCAGLSTDATNCAGNTSNTLTVRPGRVYSWHAQFGIVSNGAANCSVTAPGGSSYDSRTPGFTGVIDPCTAASGTLSTSPSTWVLGTPYAASYKCSSSWGAGGVYVDPTQSRCTLYMIVTPAAGESSPPCGTGLYASCPPASAGPGDPFATPSGGIPTPTPVPPVAGGNTTNNYFGGNADQCDNHPSTVGCIPTGSSTGQPDDGIPGNQGNGGAPPPPSSGPLGSCAPSDPTTKVGYVAPESITPFTADNPIDFIGKAVNVLPKAVGNTAAWAWNQADNAAVPGTCIATYVDGFTTEAKRHAPFAYFDAAMTSITDGLAAGAVSACPGAFTLAGYSVNLCTAYDAAFASLAPYRSVLAAIVYIAVAFAIMSRVMAVVGAGGMGGDEE